MNSAAVENRIRELFRLINYKELNAQKIRKRLFVDLQRLILMLIIRLSRQQ